MTAPESALRVLAGSPLWGTMTVHLVVRGEVEVSGQPAGDSVRVDVRELLGKSDADDILELLNPELSLRFVPSDTGSGGWFSAWAEWYDGCVLTQKEALRKRQGSALASRNTGGEIYGEVVVNLDDPAAGWDWVTAHAWYKIVGWDVAVLDLNIEQAFSGMNRPGVPPDVLERWVDGVAWVHRQGEALTGVASWRRESRAIFSQAFGCDGVECHDAYDSDCVNCEAEYSTYLSLASREDAAKWVEYLVGYSSSDPKMSIDRVVDYVWAGVGPTEARQYEFGSPGERPTPEVLHTLGGLSGR